jgi:hypothetical protein
VGEPKPGQHDRRRGNHDDPSPPHGGTLAQVTKTDQTTVTLGCCRLVYKLLYSPQGQPAGGNDTTVTG